MIVPLDDLRPEGLQVDLQLRPGPLSYVGELQIGVAAAQLSVRVRPSSEGAVCSGRMVARTTVPCSRCLELYTMHIDREFDVSFVPPPGAGSAEGDEVRISRRDLNVSYLDAQRCLDLSTLAAEQIYLEIPMKPLCSDECRGLCPRCGMNLNLEPCRCGAGGQ